jgi:hypothetical protein
LDVGVGVSARAPYDTASFDDEERGQAAHATTTSLDGFPSDAPAALQVELMRHLDKSAP